MRHIILTLLLVSALPMWAAAQNLDFMKIMRSSRNREYHMDANREQYRALWNGNGAVISSIPLWQDDEFRQQLGFTPEQLTQLDFMFSKNGSMGHWYRSKAPTDPVLAQMLAEHDPLNAQLRNDPYGETTPPETVRLNLDQLRKTTAYYFTETQKDVENLLTPEQMRAVKESELAMMEELPILNPSMFQCLDLTEEQKTQMKKKKKALEPEFEKIVEELVKLEDELEQLKFDLFEKVGIKFGENGQMVDENGKSLRDDPEAMKKKMDLLEKEMLGNAAIQARTKQFNDRASGFMRGFKFKMYDVLTDEQLIKLRRIIDNPPEFVKPRRVKLQKERAERKKEEWRPGMNSWRPGDPIPEEYLKQREQRKNFPRSESSGI
jgi:Ni/Co efflux regulator RcnB